MKQIASDEKETPWVEFYKKVPLKSFCNILRKTLVYVLESYFTKVAERDSNTGVSCEYCKILKNAYFEEHM